MLPLICSTVHSFLVRRKTSETFWVLIFAFSKITLQRMSAYNSKILEDLFSQNPLDMSDSSVVPSSPEFSACAMERLKGRIEEYLSQPERFEPAVYEALSLFYATFLWINLDLIWFNFCGETIPRTRGGSQKRGHCRTSRF